VPLPGRGVVKRYEYKWVEDDYLGLDDRIKYLNAQGIEGWLLHEMWHTMTKSYYVFVREKAE
jgi:hypothetical protein